LIDSFTLPHRCTNSYINITAIYYCYTITSLHVTIIIMYLRLTVVAGGYCVIIVTSIMVTDYQSSITVMVVPI
jgi:hypothetical protein